MADRSVLLSSRTYTVSEPGSMGQRIAVVELTPVSPSGTSATLIQLAENDRFRTDVGVVNPTGEPIQVTLEAHSAAGGSLGAETWTVPALGLQLQVNRFLRRFATGPVENGYALVSQPTGIPFVGYASVVDNAAGDPSFIPAQVVR